MGQLFMRLSFYTPPIDMKWTCVIQKVSGVVLGSFNGPPSCGQVEQGEWISLSPLSPEHLISQNRFDRPAPRRSTLDMMGMAD